MGQSPSNVTAKSGDQRAAKRFTLVLRAAKLICPAGEFLCILRDVSTTGAKVRLFHELPLGDEFTLELGSGVQHPMNRVWARDSHVGFRFADGPIDAAALMAEAGPLPKRQIRLRLERPALLWIDGAACGCALNDLSQQGARVEVQPRLPIGGKVRLAVPGLPARTARVLWRRGRAHGLVFEQSFALDELAALAAALQLPSDEIAAEDVANSA